MAAAVAIYFLYGQLLEMKDARKAANQPDLYPSYTKFQVKEVDNPTIFSDGDKPAVTVYRLEDSQPQEHIRPYIELFNIGLGAAKNISLTWDYNKQEVIDLVKGTYQYYESAELEKEHVDFLQADGKVAMKIPGLYFICCGEKLNQDFLDIVEPDNEKPKPLLKLKIKYQDIQNNWYDKTFKVKVEAFTNFVDFKFSSDE